MPKTGNGRLPSLEEQVKKFQEHYAAPKRQTCVVCDSGSRDILEILARDGHSTRRIANFARKELGMEVGETTLYKHRHEHMDAEENS